MRVEGFEFDLEVHVQTQLDHSPRPHRERIPSHSLNLDRRPNHLKVRQRRQQHLLLPRELADPAERRPAVDLAQLDHEQRRPAHIKKRGFITDDRQPQNHCFTAQM